MDDFPQVSKKSRSFKEIADSLLKQHAFFYDSKFYLTPMQTTETKKNGTASKEKGQISGILKKRGVSICSDLSASGGTAGTKQHKRSVSRTDE